MPLWNHKTFFFRVSHVQRTYLYRYQTRRCPARTCWKNHQAIRTTRLQTRGNEIVQARQRTSWEPLRWPQVQGKLSASRMKKKSERYKIENFQFLIFSPSSPVWWNTWTADQSALWSGRDSTLLKWDVWCSAKPTPRLHSQDQSEETSQFRSDEISATAQERLKMIKTILFFRECLLNLASLGILKSFASQLRNCSKW